MTGGPRPTANPERDALVERLDAIVTTAVAAEHLAGISVAVMQDEDILLERGYGYADIELRAPATEHTVYRVLGPAIAAVVMQQIERGRFRLEDDASLLLPDFPWQGRHVTVRQLMDATSGLPDLHYLGDARLAQRGAPKAKDEVTVLFAGRPFTHEPGHAWEWTISGFHLAGLLVERVTGQPYSDYLREEVIARAGLHHSFYCGDTNVVPDLAHTYEASADGFRKYAFESATLHPFIATFCASAGDAVSMMRALRDGRLINRESYGAMTTAEGPAIQAGSQGSRGVGLRIGHEEKYRWVGESGSLLGFSSAVMDFPDQSLTIAVLSNTYGQASRRIARNLARTVLGLPVIPPPARPDRSPVARDLPLTVSERERFLGTYRVTWAGAAGPFENYQRTFRIFEDLGHLMIQAVGEAPERLLYQGADTFSSASSPSDSIVFTVTNQAVTAVAITGSDFVVRGGKVGDQHFPVSPEH